jgi:hypothetical protein
MDRVRSSSYSEVTVRLTIEDASVEVITKDRYIKVARIKVVWPKSKLPNYMLFKVGQSN